MKNLMSYINFLASMHNCVIVPDLGGFVINKEPSYINDDKVLVAPRISIAFNQDLKYNDGLLAEAYMNDREVSYETACREIADAVREINFLLSSGQSVEIGNLGDLSCVQEDNSLVFSPAKTGFSHPFVFGLSDLMLQPLSKIDKSEIKLTARKVKLRSVASGAVAAAAAVLIFFVASTPVTESKYPDMQKSGFFNDILSTPVDVLKVDSVKTILPETENISQNTVEEDITSPSVVEQNKPEVKEDISGNQLKEQVVNDGGSYFVIVAGESDKQLAKRRLSQIKSEGFSNARLLESGGRTRIYVASFNNRQEAETYLKSFKTRNAKYSDAWVYSKKG